MRAARVLGARTTGYWRAATAGTIRNFLRSDIVKEPIDGFDCHIVAAVADRAVEKSAQATPRRGWLMRLMTALHDSRRRQAQRVIERHAHFFSDGDGHLDRPATSDACDRDVPFWWAPPT